VTIICYIKAAMAMLHAIRGDVVVWIQLVNALCFS